MEAVKITPGLIRKAIEQMDLRMLYQIRGYLHKRRLLVERLQKMEGAK